MEKMTEDDLLSHVEREEANCIVHFASLLSEQRRKAMQYYYGQPYGNEVEGRSQVVTTEVKDAVEGILPSLMAIFTSSDEIVRFEPQNKEDEEAAQQATDYINYVFSRLNNGFLALYCLFKDALLQKNGYVKVYWEDYEDKSKETYEGLDDNQFAGLMQDTELELKEHTPTPDEDGLKQRQQQLQQMQQQLQQGAQQVQRMPPQQMMQAQGQLQQMAAQIQHISQLPPPELHEAVFKRTKRTRKVCIDSLPPEEVLVSRETPNELTKARFVEHRTLRTLSEIREMGFDIADDIADYAPNADFNIERVERLKFDDALAYRQDSDTNDPSTKRVWLCEAYVKVDYDGDGIAELRKVTKVGKTILDNVEFDSLPIIGGTAILMPHKHYGLSLFDLVGDIQLQSSTLLRNIFDNTYLQNNSRMAVLEGMVNMSDLLTNRPGGIVRMKALGAVQPLQAPMLGKPAYELLDYLKRIGQNRVGATGFPNAVDPDAINSKAAFVDRFAEAAMERIHLMARILAEGPVKEIMWKILELESKHQDKPKMVKLRNQWVQVDPREWRNRFNMTVTVGLGTGSQQTVLQGAQLLLGAQFELLKAGMGDRVVTEGNFYASLKRIAKAVFPRDADAFVTDPSKLPPRQPQPNVDLLKLQQKDDSDKRKLKQRYDKMQQDFIVKTKELAQQHGVDLADLSLSAAELAQSSAIDKQTMLHEHVQGERDRATELAGLHIQHGHEQGQSDQEQAHQLKLQKEKPRPTAQ